MCSMTLASAFRFRVFNMSGLEGPMGQDGVQPRWLAIFDERGRVQVASAITWTLEMLEVLRTIPGIQSALHRLPTAPESTTSFTQ